MLIPKRSLPLFLRLTFASGLALAASTFPALTYSTYLRDNFTPQAIATDSSGNIYIAGNAIVDPGTSQSAVLVVKLNPQASEYLYVRYLGGSVKDAANAITVDALGNLYVAGSTASPDFPVTPGGNLGTAPTGPSSQRSFVAKLDPNGELVFSDLLGGPAASNAQAVAVNAAGQIVVSGTSASSGFPTTAAAYSIADSTNHPYLLELDPTGKKTVFSATGIGGSALVVDSSGNIYIAGTTFLLDYPTTPGAFQTTFGTVNGCSSPSCLGAQGANQYVTKVDPTGSKLMYSTSVSGTNNTTNAGLAVDAAGNAYLTGLAGTGYPYSTSQTQAPPVGPVPFTIPALPFLSKLDPLGRTLLFSVPVGGAGVQLDSNGNAYVGGGVGSAMGQYVVPSSISALASVAAQRLPNSSLGRQRSAYVSQVDATSGNVLGSQFIGGSTLTVSGLSRSGSPQTASTVWIAGGTTLPDFPFTPNALIPDLGPGPLAGAYLGAIDFSQPPPPAGTPQISCIVDSADFAPAGLGVPNQLLTILGTGLGPNMGVSATDNSTTTLGGANISFGSVSAPLLYASSTQINFAVPPVGPAPATMQLTVNGMSASPRELPLTFSNPSLFLNTALTSQATSLGSVALALNADGSWNSPTDPAGLGSTMSVFLNGLTGSQINNGGFQLITNDGWSVKDIIQATPFVLRVDVQVPSQLVNNFSCSLSSLCAVSLTLSELSGIFGGSPTSSVGEAFGGVLYINRAQ